MAAGHQREHERAIAAVLSQGHGLERAQRNRSGGGGVDAQRPAAQEAGLAHAGRGSGGVPTTGTHNHCCDDRLNLPVHFDCLRAALQGRRRTSVDGIGGRRFDNAMCESFFATP